ncbi:hypothetical protein K469DRAFT_493700, partial [Zopfia rhizophila CBS 207.26]
LVPPPRTPSPKVRIHRSQSFDSPSSRFTNSPPVGDSPFSKSASAIVAKPLPAYDAVRAAEQGMPVISHIDNKVVLHTRMSDESMSSISSTDSSPISPASSSGLGLLNDSLALPSAPSPPPTMVTPEMYQDPETPMYNPWLVRVVLNMYDVRGIDWTMIAEPIERIWGVRTSSAEVLGILTGNGRVRERVWWD